MSKEIIHTVPERFRISAHSLSNRLVNLLEQLPATPLAPANA